MKKSHLLIGLLFVFVLITFWLFKHYTGTPNFKKAQNLTNKVNNKSDVKSLSFNKDLYSLTNPSSVWVVVNKKRPLNPITFTPSDLVPVGNGQYMRREAAKALVNMISGARNNGLVIVPLSGYRSYNTQLTVYNREIKNFGQNVADSESARPGFSEHQTGLALDLGGGGCGIEDCFTNTKEGKWVAANAYKYGFIIRYTAAKKTITGYRAEPWHVRYIGTLLSNEMHKQGISTLEEFFNLSPAPTY